MPLRYVTKQMTHDISVTRKQHVPHLMIF